MYKFDMESCRWCTAINTCHRILILHQILAVVFSGWCYFITIKYFFLNFLQWAHSKGGGKRKRQHVQIPHECEAPFGRPPCITHPSKPEDRGAGSCRSHCLSMCSNAGLRTGWANYLWKIIDKGFPPLRYSTYSWGLFASALCSFVLFVFFNFSSSDIPELWLLLCLDRNFSSWQSWFFYCIVPVDAIFLFICTGMVSYILISKLIPSFLLYFQKTDISSKTMLLSVGITEQPLQMFLLSFLQEPVPHLCPEFISRLLCYSWDSLHTQGGVFWLSSCTSRQPPWGRLWELWVPVVGNRRHRNICSCWQNGSSGAWCSSSWGPSSFQWRKWDCATTAMCPEVENRSALTTGKIVEGFFPPHQETQSAKTKLITLEK